jgi:hypothetical protein
MVRLLVKTVIVVLLIGSARDASAQYRPAPAAGQTIDLAGPRIGMTLLSPEVRSTLNNDTGLDVGSVITQFGWQKEKRFLSSPDGFTGVTEGVLLIGGLEQGVVLPSLSWLVGVRTATGIEFAVGPNLTPAGIALAGAAGVTFQKGNLNIPVNIALVPSRSGLRVSLLAGFNSRRR